MFRQIAWLFLFYDSDTFKQNLDDFFHGAKHGEFERTGAEKVTGLSLNMYQQLLRFMHLVDNKDSPNPESENFDKCWKIRPLIKLLCSLRSVATWSMTVVKRWSRYDWNCVELNTCSATMFGSIGDPPMVAEVVDEAIVLVWPGRVRVG